MTFLSPCMRFLDSNEVPLECKASGPSTESDLFSFMQAVVSNESIASSSP